MSAWFTKYKSYSFKNKLNYLTWISASTTGCHSIKHQSCYSLKTLRLSCTLAYVFAGISRAFDVWQGVTRDEIDGTSNSSSEDKSEQPESSSSSWIGSISDSHRCRLFTVVGDTQTSYCFTFRKKGLMRWWWVRRWPGLLPFSFEGTGKSIWKKSTFNPYNSPFTSLSNSKFSIVRIRKSNLKEFKFCGNAHSINRVTLLKFLSQLQK